MKPSTEGTTPLPRPPKRPVLARLDQLPKLAPTAWQLYFAGCKWNEELEIERERRFFASLRLRRGVFKSTDAGRLKELDELVARLLPPERPLKLMDVAVSSGVTTADWMGSLDRAGIEHDMVASDLCIQAWLLSLGRRIHVLVDKTGYPLQYDIFGLGVRTSSGKAAIDRLLAYVRRAVTAMFRRHKLWRRCRQATPQALVLPARRSAETTAEGLWSLRRILLISGRLSGRANLSLLEEDLLAEPLPELRHRFHAVRAANILSSSYFTEAELRRMIANLRTRLKPEGLLIVCRTEDDGVNNATVFQLGADRSFHVSGELGAGADVRELILDRFTVAKRA